MDELELRRDGAIALFTWLVSAAYSSVSPDVYAYFHYQPEGTLAGVGIAIILSFLAMLALDASGIYHL